MTDPKPFDESQEPKKFWREDEFEQFLPKEKGFISDFIYFTRGIEAPTLFSFWGALIAISSIVKREAWINWGPLGNLYSNLYVFLVAPPGIGKTTIVDIVDKVLNTAPDFIEDENIRAIKQLKILRNKSTSEAILSFMTPNTQGGKYVYFKDKSGRSLMIDGKPVKYRKGSDVVILLSELSSLFSKTSYSEGTIELLVDIYDAKDIYEWRTVKRGVIKLRNLFTTLFGATTPKSLVKYLPRAVIGDGFMSRTMVAYADKTVNVFPVPVRPEYGPTAVDICERLAWIAETYNGEFTLSYEALERYSDWYSNTFKPMLEKDTLYRDIRNREGINVLKLALLLRMSKYRPGNKIEKPDIDDAIRILYYTYNTSINLIRQAGSEDFMQKVAQVQDFLSKTGEINRRDALRRLHIPAAVLTQVIAQLMEEGLVEVWYQGRRVAYIPGTTREVYKYVEPKEGQKDDPRTKEADKAKDLESIPNVRIVQGSSKETGDIEMVSD